MESSKTKYCLLEKMAVGAPCMPEKDEMIVVHRLAKTISLNEKIEIRRLQIIRNAASESVEMKPIVVVPQEIMQMLSKLHGNWKLRGNDPLNPETPDLRIFGTESYEWLPGGHFLSGKWNMFLGSGQYQGVSVMGYNAAKEQFYQTNFDNAGYVRHYKLKVCGNKWTITGNRERTIVFFASDGQSFIENREISPDNKTWKQQCSIHAEKVPS